MTTSTTLHLTGPALIEASAGTGKTYTIAHLYTRLVIGHRQPGEPLAAPLTPAEILVMTFTEAATLELRDRIRRRLVDAAAAFASGEPGDPALAELLAMVSPEDRPRALHRLREAAESMDQAAIYTIHGWCLRVLSEHAFESNIIAGSGTSTDGPALYLRTVQDFWRTLAYESSPREARLVHNLFPDPEKILTGLAELKGVDDRRRVRYLYRDQPLEENTTARAIIAAEVQREDERDALENDARAIWRQDEGELLATLQELRPYLNRRSYSWAREDREYYLAINALKTWAHWSPGEVPQEMPGNLPGGLAQNEIRLNKGGVLPEHRFFTALQKWKDCATEVDPSRVKAHVLAIALRHIRETFRREKRRHGVLDFDDMIHVFDEALRGDTQGVLAHRIARRYPVALVDEFQDTDPVQFSILSRLYLPHGTLLVIGDPKQAIYRFRGADISTYLRARRHLPGRMSLPVNWRSTGALVHCVNTFFSHADTWQRGAFLLGDREIPFLPVEPREDSADDPVLVLQGDRSPAVTMVRIHRETIRENSSPEVLGIATYRRESAAICAAMITRWLTPGTSYFLKGDTRTPLEGRDVAILVRSRREAEIMRRALAEHRIPTVFLSERGSIFATPEARDMLLWLRAFHDPGNPRHRASVVASASCALPLDSIVTELVRGEAADHWHDTLAECSARWHHRGILAALRFFLHQTGTAARLLAARQSGSTRKPADSTETEETVETAETAGDGERTLTNILHLGEWLQHREEDAPAQKDLISLLEEQIDNPGEEEILRLEREESAVRIVTIHKSKGLEYPVVVMPFAAAVPKNSSGKPWVWRDSHTTEDPGITVEFDPVKGTAGWENRTREELSEAMRLLYVAMTRARHALFMSVAPVRSGNSSAHQLDRTAIGYALDGGNTPGFDIDAALTSLAAAAGEDSFRVCHMAPRDPSGDDTAPSPGETAAPAPPPEFRRAKRRHHSPWWVASFTALVSGITPLVEPADRSEIPDEAMDQETPEPSGDHQEDPLAFLPPGARTGTLVHSIIEAAGTAGFSGLRDNQDARRAVIQSVLDHSGVSVISSLSHREDEGDPSRVALVDRWLQQFLRAPMAPGAPPPADLEEYRMEMEFLLPSAHASTEHLDALVGEHIFPREPRPLLEPRMVTGFLKGFIDLVYRQDSRYFLADWKTNTLGRNSTGYTEEAMKTAVLEKRYDVQAALYGTALHRHLKRRIPRYHPGEHLGPATYVFLRSPGDAPRGITIPLPTEMILAVDQLFREGGA